MNLLSKNKNGFTLIELLAIIVIIGIIAVIAVPTVKKLTEYAKKKAFINTAHGIIKAGDLYYSKKDMMDEINGDMIFKFPDNAEELELSGKVPENGNMTINKDGDIELVISNKDYCITKGFNDKDITVKDYVDECKIENLYVDSILNGADPLLREGMIPVIISENGTVTKADRSQQWYDYTNKEWANAVLVNNDSRETYETMSAGEPIQESDILAYFVWIPRYKYKLWYVESLNGYNDMDLSKVHSIDIVFENKKSDKSDGICDATEPIPMNGCYLTHPAFTFGEEELNGIWVGKFETGYNGATTSEGAQKEEEDSTKVIIKPNAYSWRYNTISNMFFTTLYMNDENNIFGLTTNSDTHMMKNTEWGAVTYLAFSKYGKDSEVYLNNNSNYLTGCGADATDSDENSECLNSYGTKSDNIYNQSTTGNISGIFDMSGGASEFVMGYSNRATTIYGSSGFTSDTFPEDKYIDIYTSISKNDYIKRILGDATGEMGPVSLSKVSDSFLYKEFCQWYEDKVSMVVSTYPWFERGGTFSGTSGTGIINSSYDVGASNAVSSFRIVLI